MANVMEQARGQASQVREETRGMMDKIGRPADMSDTEIQVRYGIGAAAAAAAIFAPVSYKWKGILTAIAAETILTGIYRYRAFGL